MDGHGFEAEGRPAVKYVDDPELAYVMLRYREVHDFVHVLTGIETSVEGELVLKWIELLQTGLPMTLLCATVGPLRLSSQSRRLLLMEWVPWAARTAVQVLMPACDGPVFLAVCRLSSRVSSKSPFLYQPSRRII